MLIRVCAVIAIVIASPASEIAHASGLEAYDTLLRESVQDGHVDYSAFASSEAFPVFLEEIANQDLNSFESVEDRLAFYINAYNALTIQSIVNGKSPANLLRRFSFFKRNKHVVAGESISLFDFEHDKIIPLNEPRIHFAIVCAAIACAPLRSEAYRAEDLDDQLDEQAIDFINDQDKNFFDAEKRTARLSKIFKWYRNEFETVASTLDEYLAFYHKDPETAKALEDGEYNIKYQKYDWNLNGTAP